MSVEKLELKSPADADIVIEVSGNEFEIVVGMISEEDGARSESIVYLDRSQAHLLMLYLQEHLGNRILSKEEVLKGIDKTLNEVSVFEKEIWNAAIEKAANELRINSTGNWVEPYLEQIRKLKV